MIAMYDLVKSRMTTVALLIAAIVLPLLYMLSLTNRDLDAFENRLRAEALRHLADYVSPVVSGNFLSDNITVTEVVRYRYLVVGHFDSATTSRIVGPHDEGWFRYLVEDRGGLGLVVIEGTTGFHPRENLEKVHSSKRSPFFLTRPNR